MCARTLSRLMPLAAFAPTLAGGEQGVRANAVAPGLVLTETMSQNLDPPFRDMAMAVTRSARLGRPDDIAAMVAFLASDDGEWINGQVISVDGGATMR